MEPERGRRSQEAWADFGQPDGSIVDEEGNDLPARQIGELLVKGRRLAGYLNDPEETRRVFSDGAAHQDLARQERTLSMDRGRKGAFLKCEEAGSFRS